MHCINVTEESIISLIATIEFCISAVKGGSLSLKIISVINISKHDMLIVLTFGSVFFKYPITEPNPNFTI